MSDSRESHSPPPSFGQWIHGFAWISIASFLVGLFVTRYHESLWAYPTLSRTSVLDLEYLIYGAVYILWALAMIWSASYMMFRTAGEGISRRLSGMFSALIPSIFFSTLLALGLVGDNARRYWQTILELVGFTIVCHLFVRQSKDVSLSLRVLAGILGLPAHLHLSFSSALGIAGVVVTAAFIQYPYVSQAFGGGAPVAIRLQARDTLPDEPFGQTTLLKRVDGFIVVSDSFAFRSRLSRRTWLIPESRIASMHVISRASIAR